MDDESQAIVPLESSVPSKADTSEALVVLPPEQVVTEVAKVMDLIAARLELQTPHPATAKRVRGARTVPREFVLSMMAAAERRQDLPALARFDSPKAQAALQAADAYRLIAERTELFLSSLKYTIEAQWAEVVRDAMQTFSIASVVAENPEEAELSAEVENLRKKLGRKGLRKKKKKATKE